jgi:hypothetical protein
MAEQGTHKPLVGSSNLPVATEPTIHDEDIMRWLILDGGVDVRRDGTPG